MPALPIPQRCEQPDPTPIFEHFRGAYATELLTAAVAHFGLFGLLAAAPQSFAELGARLGLAERPLHVLLTALQAMGLIAQEQGEYRLTPLAEYLVPGSPLDVGDYVSLAAQSPGVLAMVERLRSNRPANADSADGTAFIYRDGQASAMDHAASARHFTLALAGRARHVAPRLAEVLPISAGQTLLDLAGGTGIYALELLRANPELNAILFDRPAVLEVAAACVGHDPAGTRLQFVPGDMFSDPWPKADVILLSNVLHDWDIPTCQTLIKRAADHLPPGGMLAIHDVFLHDDLAGPLPLALYSAALFTLTEGRAYSAAEYQQWLTAAGFAVEAVRPTAIHCGVLTGKK